MDDFIGDSFFLGKLYDKRGIDWDSVRTADILFASSSQTADPQTDAWIPNNALGYWDATGPSAVVEAEKLGADVQWTGSPKPDLETSPYPSRMRPVRDISFLKTASDIYIVGVDFRAFDVKKQGSSYQTAAVFTELVNSLSTYPNQGSVQSRMIGEIRTNSMFTFFNPKVYVDSNKSMNVLSNLALTNQFGDTTAQKNLGDLSVGMPLPYQRLIYKYVKNNVDLSVYAFCAERVVDSATGNIYIRRFPLLCWMTVAYIL